MKAVLSIGGSTIGYPPDTEWVSKLSSLIREERDKIPAIVVGGGPLARNMIGAVSKLSDNNQVKDMVGIGATLLNAWLFKAALGEMATEPKLYEGPFLEKGRINIFGGSILPGLTTDFVALSVAEYVGGVVINITNVEGIYDENGKVMPSIDYDELLKMAIEKDIGSPGSHFPLDIPSILLAKRSSIPIVVVGKRIEVVRDALKGRVRGTVVGQSELLM